MTKTFKRIVILSDGTWHNLDNDNQSNIIKLAFALDSDDDAGVQQVVFYDPGVGMAGGPTDFLLGGAVGTGIDRNIQQLYAFLALNYDEGDEIYLFGYSRGAYTVRSLAGLIHDAGLVRRDQVQWAAEAYSLYRDNIDPDSDRAYNFRKAHGDRVPIKLVACFDTVGALGAPFGGIVRAFNDTRYSFHDMSLGTHVEHGIHMVSIDEERYAFALSPMLANKAVGDAQVTERFFWGGHGEIGGEFEAGKATMAFLVEEMEQRGIGLQLNRANIPVEYDVLDVARGGSIGYLAIQMVVGKDIRMIESVGQLHLSAIRRYQMMESWRPAALQPIHEEILAYRLE